MDRAQSRIPSDACKARRRGWAIRALFAAPVCSAIASRAVTVLEQLEEITREGHMLSPDTIEELGRKEAEKARWSTIALWIIAICLNRDF